MAFAPVRTLILCLHIFIYNNNLDAHNHNQHKVDIFHLERGPCDYGYNSWASCYSYKEQVCGSWFLHLLYLKNETLISDGIEVQAFGYITIVSFEIHCGGVLSQNNKNGFLVGQINYSGAHLKWTCDMSELKNVLCSLWFFFLIDFYCNMKDIF